MAKPPTSDDTTVFDFDAFVTDSAAKSGGKPIDFTMPTGETFHVPAPLDWSDDIVELQTAASAAAAKPKEYPPVSPVALARAFLEAGGEGQWDRFKAAGGTAMHFMKFLENKIGTPGESPAS